MPELLPQIIIAIVAGSLGAIISGYFNFKGSEASSVGDVINSLTKRLENYEKRLNELEEKLELQSLEIQHWKDAYFKLLKWLKNLFSAHDIKETIPEFHKDSKNDGPGKN